MTSAIAASTLMLGTANVAHAQSSVVFYGLLDAGIQYNKTSNGNRFSESSGNVHGDRWGLKGQEDLGGGMKSVFDIENGFSISNGTLGQGSREFGRQAWVGLSDKSLGTVTIGRQYDPIVDSVQSMTADSFFGGAFATPGDQIRELYRSRLYIPPSIFIFNTSLDLRVLRSDRYSSSLPYFA